MYRNMYALEKIHSYFFVNRVFKMIIRHHNKLYNLCLISSHFDGLISLNPFRCR